jgi:hypothetical protein
MYSFRANFPAFWRDISIKLEKKGADFVMAETGHARNIEHFATMIGFVDGYGVAYNPSNAAIELAALQAKVAAAQHTIDGVTTAIAPQNPKVNVSESAYKKIQNL